MNGPTSAERRDARNREIYAAADRLRVEVERQDAAGFRDWHALVEETIRGLPPAALLHL